VLEAPPENRYSILLFSSPDLTAGTYTLWSNDAQLAGQRTDTMGGPGMGGMSGMVPGGGMPPDFSAGEMPNGEMIPAMPEGAFPGGTMPSAPPDWMTQPEGGNPFEGQTPPEGMEWPDGNNPGNMPGGQWMPGGGNAGTSQELTTEFQISDGGNMFQSISKAN